MSLIDFQTALTDFGSMLGLPELTTDADGFCCISLDDVVISLQHDEDNDEVLAFSRLGSIHPDAPKEAYIELLAANLFWSGTNGATLAIQPEDNSVFIHTRFSATTLTSDKLSTRLDEFSDAAAHWTGELEDLGTVDLIESLIMSEEESTPDKSAISV